MRAAEHQPATALDRLVAEFGTFYFDEQRHRMSLPLLARWLLVDDRPEEALKLLLRYWRTGPDGVADRLLEAAIRRRLQGPAAALPALRRAFVIDPTDPAVQRRLLAGQLEAGGSAEAAATATRLLRSARDPDVLAAALDVAEPGWTFFGVADLDGRTIEGWCAWKGERRTCTCTVVADGRRGEATVSEQPHPVWGRADARFGRFRIAWPAGATIVSLQDAAGARPLRGTPLMNDEILDRGILGPLLPPARDGLEVTVIVPVYADPEATRRCFESLRLDRGSTTLSRVIAVDDASPDAMIRALLDRLAASGQVQLLRNPQNVGFIRAVNRALKHVGQEDVVLLNADTMVPPGWLDRLRAAALEPDVGTVTPLSNNGELVSMPAAFRPNPMPSSQLLAEIDRAARELGPARVDMPNGTGFCLYIRNDALRAVGGLDDRHYERGYLEEVDFCLRVAAAGYRNVCATDLFVAHHGEASFGTTKRELVMANACALVRRWPRIEAETEAFVRADPLAAIRAALAWPSLSRERPRRLVVTAGAAVGRAVKQRLAQDAPDLDLAVLSAPDLDPGTWRATWDGLDAPVPLPAELRGAGCGDALGALMDWLCVEDVILLAGAGGLPLMGETWLECGAPVDIMPVEAGWALTPALGEGARRLLLASSRTGLGIPPAAPPCTLLPVPGLDEPLCAAGGAGEAMGIIPHDAHASTFSAIRDLARALHARASSRPLIVFGGTFRDVGLLRLGNVFVTGPLRDDRDWREALEAHPCGGLMLTQRGPSLLHEGHDVIRRAGLPFAAYRAGGAADLLDELPGGLELDPAWSRDQLALVIDTFLSASALAGMRRSLTDAA